jgi:hypothetical protein
LFSHLDWVDAIDTGRQLEPYRPPRLLLPDDRSIHRVAARCNVINAKCDDVTTALLAVDGQI